MPSSRARARTEGAALTRCLPGAAAADPVVSLITMALAGSSPTTPGASSLPSALGAGTASFATEDGASSLAGASPPGTSKRASTSPTGITSPASPCSEITRPVTGDGTSTTALSVSTETSG